ncbi:MAG: type II toxin-antitoxin system RelE/ParE family toxin [Calditrichia bacterium]
MKYKVQIISDAEDDLFDIFRYVAENDSLTRDEIPLDKLEEAILSLDELPHRGHIPAELKRVAVFDYLEIHYKPYRIIYQIISKRVYVHCVLDGRRDLEEILRNRLLR